MAITSIERRLALIAGGVALLALPAWARTDPPRQSKPMVQIWKSPSCGCCKDWIVHLEANGFATQVSDVGNAAARKRLGIQDKHGSCHTALVGGYALEGHVPAKDIQRLLRERPTGIGLAVPFMPVGSPGMDGPEYGDRKDPYDVLLLAKDGSARVFQSYR
ncbi:DUF411 domain-containing protein [Ideonella sp.]|uniref:DUF411 domain-containing protein n=1 Tax=Ideonella sp. TaxID=1929293 RepID=UPI003BB7602B